MMCTVHNKEKNSGFHEIKIELEYYPIVEFEIVLRKLEGLNFVF
jgi:hypothetical protein